MPNVKISAAADAGTLLATDMLPLARSGNTNAYHATMTEIAAFATTSISSGAYGNVGRNLLHNPLFNVAQRGAGPFTVSGAYTLDRWIMSFGLDTLSVQSLTLADGSRAQIGDEAAATCLQASVTGNAGTTAYSAAIHRIEKVRRLSGKTVTVSFWAAGSVALKLGASLNQTFGTGGSPSATVTGNGQSVQLTTSFARYSLTFALPSATGMTFGTNGDDYTALNLWFSGGASNNTITGSVGVQSGTIYIWGIQLEVGSVATPLEKPDPRYDLSNCQRFYQARSSNIVCCFGAAGNTWQSDCSLPASMRASPTVVYSSIAYANASGLTFGGSTPELVRSQLTLTSVAGLGSATFAMTASADL